VALSQRLPSGGCYPLGCPMKSGLSSQGTYIKDTLSDSLPALYIFLIGFIYYN